MSIFSSLKLSLELSLVSRSRFVDTNMHLFDNPDPMTCVAIFEQKKASIITDIATSAQKSVESNNVKWTYLRPNYSEYLYFPIFGFEFDQSSNYLNYITKVFVFNTNLAFLTLLYKNDIEGFQKFQQKINLPPVGIELTTPTINGLEVRCLFHSATQTCIAWKILK